MIKACCCQLFHLSVRENFPCPQCGKVLYSDGGLKHHIAVSILPDHDYFTNRGLTLDGAREQGQGGVPHLRQGVQGPQAPRDVHPQRRLHPADGQTLPRAGLQENVQVGKYTLMLNFLATSFITGTRPPLRSMLMLST